ncbi:MAG: DUF3196 domain-containing protein [Solobacterium sp.]|nr:DUF3196 domain-containing protein [Solobacterium sp.]
MAEYYDEILNEIDQYIARGEYDDAAFLVRRELAMPYIPPETEQALRSREADLRFLRTARRREKEWTLSEILDQLLHGREKGQLAAAAKLTERNLRNCTAELQTYLSRDPLPEAASLIIDSLAEQEVNEEFVYRKNGVEYTFWADAVTPVSASTGFRKALRIMENHYLQDPVKAEAAKGMLIHECYLFLPLSYEEDEADRLAEEIISQVEDLYSD